MAQTHDVGTSSTGFLKVSTADGSNITKPQRAALIRKGNEFFNSRDLVNAKRIFLTVRYSDGLIRLGDHYLREGDPLEAFRMFWVAGDSGRVAEMAEKMAGVIRRWLQEDR
ncbi:MAG: hypothetical protein MI724_17700 [Spirochaetales bacterium]|nr:hypothetical protein [Spirochaetales bacterium]